MSYKRPESVLVVIYNDTQDVLVLQRNDDANFWQSVTGSLEEEEAPLAAAIREVAEETGIDAAAEHCQITDHQQSHNYTILPHWRVRYAPGVTVNKEHVFSLQVQGQPNIHLTEHQGYLWLPKAQAIAKVWSKTNKQAIEQYVV